MPVDEVAALLARWRDADGVLDRGRVLGNAARLLAGLDRDERRVLAQALADEGAPELADRIGHDLSADQVRGAARGLLSLDRDTVDHLVDQFADPDTRDDLARRALGDLPPPPSDERALLSELELDDIGDLELGEVELGEAQLLDADPLVEPDLHEVTLGPATTLAGVVPGAAPASAAGSVSDAAPDTDEPAEPPTTATRPGAAAADREGALDAAGSGFQTGRSGRDELAPVTRSRDGSAPGAGSGPEGAAQALAELDRHPPGWARRRAAMRLAERRALPLEDLGPVLARLPRPMDRRFLAGQLVAQGDVDPSAFEGALSERDIRRLRIRRAR